MKKLLISLIFIIPFLLTGCLEPIELSNIGIVVGMGIEISDEGYEVTLQILNPPAISGQQQHALATLELHENARSIHEAFKLLDQRTSAVLTLSHLEVIVIGEKFAEKGLSPFVNYALRHSDIRPDINMVVAKGVEPKQILQVVTAFDAIPAIQINPGTLKNSRANRIITKDLYEVADAINSPIDNMVLTAITLYLEEYDVTVGDKQGEDKFNFRNKFETIEEINANKDKPDIGRDGPVDKKKIDKEIAKSSTQHNALDSKRPVQIRKENAAVFNGDKIIGYITDSNVQKLNILKGSYKRYDLVAITDDKEYYTSAGLTTLDVKVKSNMKNNEITYKVTSDAIILENTYPIDFTYNQNLQAASEFLSKRLKEDLEDFVKQSQETMKVDFLGIAGHVSHQEKKLWREIEGYWDDIFPHINIIIEVEIDVNSTGEIGNVTL